MEQIKFRHGATLRMTTTKTYDYLGRLTSISSAPSADSTVSFAYQYNNANERTQMTLADGSYWVYGYDSLGQVTSGKRYWSDGTPVAGQQFEYAFDDIGNRTQTKAGGDAAGVNLRTETYGANKLNQHTNRSVSGTVDIMGIAHASATVTVNGQSPIRKGEYYDAPLAFNNSSTALRPAITNSASLLGTSQSVTGSLFIAKTPEVFIYDADGNLISDGRWTNQWDSENRLVAMTSLPGAPSGSERRLLFSYDTQGRRITKRVEIWTNNVWSVVLTNKFVYDGWNLLAEVNGTNQSVINSFMWGLDLSGSMQGAGGVGGLLAASGATGTSTVAYDGNGNVVALISATNGVVCAIYQYDPFGRLLRTTGVAHEQPFRFSSKYNDTATGLIYYGFRYFSVADGCWMSRDLIFEKGGLNLFAFVKNNSVNFFDPFGLADAEHRRPRPRPCPPFDCEKWANEDKTWLSGLPKCPCSISGNPDAKVWNDPAPADKKYHPGASQCMRSKPVKDGGPGQQCCYDASGKLITGGAGAGTPDKVAPVGPLDALAHWSEDVHPFSACPLSTYLKGRPPNNGNNCEKNEK